MNSNETNKRPIIAVMALLDREYPGRFTASRERIEIWTDILGQYDTEVVLAAAKYLVGVCEHPPTLARVRGQCALLVEGRLEEQSGSEAWEILWQRIREADGGPVHLTDLERRVLAQVGTLYDLKRSSNPSLDRAHWIRAWETTTRQARLESSATPDVRAIADRYAAQREVPSLPASDRSAVRLSDALPAALPTREPGDESESTGEDDRQLGLPVIGRCVCGHYYQGSECPECGAGRE